MPFPSDLPPLALLILAAVAMIGGCMDAIAGGGGLITMPAVLMAGLPPHMALGTNKGQAIFGSGMSSLTLWRAGRIDKRRGIWRFALAASASALGTLAVLQVSTQALKPVVLALLLAAAALMFVRKRVHSACARPDLARVLLALSLGFYDGFFGPGVGILHILGGMWLLGQMADQASAEAKIANFGSNMGAFVVFALAGKVVWPVAAVMAAGQFAGGWIGAHALMRIGPEWVRRVGVAVCFGLVAKVGWDWFHPAQVAQPARAAEGSPAVSPR